MVREVSTEALLGELLLEAVVRFLKKIPYSPQGLSNFSADVPQNVI
jgi:hypothetical protein